MALTKQQQLLRIEKEYRLAQGVSGPVDPHRVAAFAIQRGLWRAPHKSLVGQCARELAHAMRTEYFTDAKGRRVRAKHPAKSRRGDETLSLWDDIRTADRRHMETSFAQRREQIVGDCRQLKTDVDSYNDAHADQTNIQLVLDFTMDVAEIEAGNQRGLVPVVSPRGLLPPRLGRDARNLRTLVG